MSCQEFQQCITIWFRFSFSLGWVQRDKCGNTHKFKKAKCHPLDGVAVIAQMRIVVERNVVRVRHSGFGIEKAKRFQLGKIPLATLFFPILHIGKRVPVGGDKD